ncbi:MAG: hypothetical protein QM752_07195 [Gammaproteobacteria bacterium]
MQNPIRDLFALQTELVDAKVEVSVSKAISQVIEQIVNFRQEVQRDFDGLKHQMHREISSLKYEMLDRFSKVEDRFSKVKSRLASVETALGRRDQVRSELRTRFFDYTFRAGWAIGLVTLSAAVSSLVFALHSMF